MIPDGVFIWVSFCLAQCV